MNRLKFKISLFSPQPSAYFFLVAGTVLLCFSNLASRSLWTQEGRWALICAHMLSQKNYWQPVLAGVHRWIEPFLRIQ
jgi:hypothetical protein